MSDTMVTEKVLLNPNDTQDQIQSLVLHIRIIVHGLVDIMCWKGHSYSVHCKHLNRLLLGAYILKELLFKKGTGPFVRYLWCVLSF